MLKWIKSRKGIVLMMTMVFMVGVVGCGGSDDGQSAGDGLSGDIQVAGSTSVQPLSEELATVFMDINPDVTIDVAGGGSSAGVKSASEGTADIGASSRELQSQEKSLGLKETVIAKDGIAVVVNPNNGVDDLTLDQVKKIYTGAISNWSEVGGKDAAITVINREEGSGTRGAFHEIVLGEDGQFTNKAAIQNSTGAVRTSVAQDDRAIGYVSMGAMSNDVKAIKIDGVDPITEDVVNGSYKIARPFIYLTKGEENEVTKAFIDWVLSPEGQEIVAEEFVPVTK